ncbi:MAG TPA: phosphoribosyltransferase [Burkholderiaceae bacterium]|nr:phosphoribosyltransferase [Burkholderiaceae bacterium]
MESTLSIQKLFMMAIKMPTVLKNRMQAGELLAQRMLDYTGRGDVIVLALPRGGVPVGLAIAKKLAVPLDILLVHKLGMPGHEEYAIGAIASSGVCLLQAEILSALDLPTTTIEAVAQRELGELKRREKLYRSERPALQLRERIVILTDDGMATGSTMLAAVHMVREANPMRLIIAIPVAAPEAYEKLKPEVDEIICLSIPEPFHTVGRWYENFEQVSDSEVKSLLDEMSPEQMRPRRSLHTRQRK